METIVFGSSAGDSIYWDGKNSIGNTVSNGNYEIQVIVKTAKSGLVQANKTVMVLKEKDEYLDKNSIRVVPNPVVNSTVSGGKMSITWETSVTGKIRFYIYNIAGELVRVFETRLENKSVSWDLKTTGGEYASGGAYLAVMEAVNSDGNAQKAVVKFSVIYK
jgi:flagellar hook assembly protein FlgD